MFTIPNILLLCMIVSYCNPIKIVYDNFNNNYSISEIITNDNIKYNIFFWAILMGSFTILYEFSRNYTSLIIILFLLLGIIGVVFTKEEHIIFCYHTFFAIIAFLSINIFMICHAYHKSDSILYCFFLIQILLLILTLKNIKIQIFFYECMLLLNFFIFYIYLHFIEN